MKQEYKKLFGKEVTKDHARKVIKGINDYKNLKYGSPVGVLSDTHFPFVHKNYLEFVYDTFNQYNVGKIVHCGDIIDHHAISRHTTEPDALGAHAEMEEAIDCVERYSKALGELVITRGNHDDIPQRQAKTLGISDRFLKGISEVYEFPSNWSVVHEIMLDNVLYTHGINCTGKTGALNKAMTEQRSVVIGHSHAWGGCQYLANTERIIFGMNVGCGIDIKRYAFAYGKHAKYRPTLGCGIVFNDSNAIFVPMGDKYFN